MNDKNITLQTDSYKAGGHWNMYPDGTEFIYSYFESRKGALFDETPFFGLQALLRNNLEGVVVTQEKIDEAAALCLEHFGTDTYFNRKGWEHILKKHGGKLPLLIKAVPEGTPVTVSNVLMSVENTDPAVPWLTNYVESLLTHVWYPSTVAALSRATKKMIKTYLDKTADSDAGLSFMLHDFGYRGVSSDESACYGGAAHLINFLGTDTMLGMDFAIKEYGASRQGLAYSVAALEHSVTTSRGRDGEAEVLSDMLQKYPKGILSFVADSYDIYHFVGELVCKQFKHRIESRDGVFVVRPDSVTPLHPKPEDETVWIVQTLANAFGYTTNGKGYMVLNPKIRVLWGDGIDKDGIELILTALMKAGFSAENMVFGMGGGLLQKVNRDTQRFAFKCAAQCRNGTWHDVYKEPKDLSKVSKRGKLALIKDETGQFQTVRAPHDKDLLQTVFENGQLIYPTTFDEIRARSAL